MFTGMADNQGLRPTNAGAFLKQSDAPDLPWIPLL